PSMKTAEFEQRFLRLINERSFKITAANVAYQLELSIDEVQEHLLALELNGTLIQRTDEQGGSYWEMPHRPQPGTLLAPATIEQRARRSLESGHPPEQLKSAPIYATSASAPARGRSINGMVLNALLPGLGSLICGQ